MIDFACKQFLLKDVVKCALGLTKAELRLLEVFMSQREEWHTSEELAKTVSLNLSTVQRGVKKLYEKDVLIRSQENLKDGGYVFLYQIARREALHKLIMNIIDRWTKKLEEELKKW